jgi:hypothetical protein
MPQLHLTHSGGARAWVFYALRRIVFARGGPTQYVRAASVGDLAPGQGKFVKVESRRIALFKVAGTYYALNESPIGMH